MGLPQAWVDATHAVVGIDFREVGGVPIIDTGVLEHHTDEFSAHRDVAMRRGRGARVFVAVVIDGRISPEDFKKFSEVLREYYSDRV